VAHENALDLAGLDAKAADLHLVVDAPEVFEIAIGEPASEVARAVQALRRARARRAPVDEALRVELGPVQVAPAHAGAADEHFADRARWHGREVLVQHVHLQVGNRMADHAAAAGFEIGQADGAVRHVHRGLGDAVHVDELRLRVAMPIEPWTQHLQLERLAAEDDAAQDECVGGRAADAVGLDQRAKRGGRLG